MLPDFRGEHKNSKGGNRSFYKGGYIENVYIKTEPKRNRLMKRRI